MPLFPKHHLLSLAVIILAAGWVHPVASEAGVVVLANRTDAKVDFTVAEDSGKTSRHGLKPGDVLPISVDQRIGVAFDVDGTPQRVLLRANSIHYFLERDEKLNLFKISLSSTANRADPAPPARTERQLSAVCTIPVMLLVDDDEPAVRRVWEKRLRERLDKASKIIEHHARVRFEVAAVGTWETSDSADAFEETLREFELNVKPAPARLAVGFTSQYKAARGRIHLGGTRGPLHSHILIREWSQHVTRSERLEVLVHEFGHFLGATHSAEPLSVMRSKLGDHLSHARSFRIGFDPVNTLVMYLMGEELRAGRWFRGFGGIPPATKAQLRDAYTAMAEILPEDESSKRYIELLDRSPNIARKPTAYPKPLVEATQAVVGAVVEAAGQNHRLPVRSQGASRLKGDRLTEYYLRRAAATAAELPDDVAAKAFLLGLGIALDDSRLLRYGSPAAAFCRHVESNQERIKRLAVLGSPAMRGRPDLAKHFTVSGLLTALFGPKAAEAFGIGKELKDSRGPGGFSFADFSADLAGTIFASEVLRAKIPLARLATSFTVEDFLPETSGLDEGISWDDFRQQYGLIQDDRFVRQRKAIRQRIVALPGYQTP